MDRNYYTYKLLKRIVSTKYFGIIVFGLPIVLGISYMFYSDPLVPLVLLITFWSFGAVVWILKFFEEKTKGK